MALVPEDGTGRSDADSLVSLSSANAYWADHGSPAEWTGATDPEKESALRYATIWVGYRWGWSGFLLRNEQALPWPRSGVIDDEGRSVPSDSVPDRIVAAVCEMALIHLSNPLTEPQDGGLDALKVDVIELDFATSEGAVTDYPQVRSLVLAYVRDSGGQRLVRA